MARLFYTFAVVFLFWAAEADAQEVFKSVYESAQKALNEPVQNFTKKRIAKFKIDELDYLKRKVGKMESIKRNDILDVQAYYMSEFLSRYLTEIVYSEGQPDSVRKALVYLFVNASAVCPLFNDTDKDTINKYLNSPDSQLTPFCLDTDWRKAYIFVNKAME